jgi:hypothetical protein
LDMAPALNAAKIFVYGFSLVFCAIGLGIGYGAVNVFQDGDTKRALLMLFAALAFGGFGLAVYALTRAGFRTQAREKELQEAFPQEPWKWREDWAEGRVRSTSSSTLRFLWGFAILWNLISSPILIVLIPEEVIEKQNYGALIGLLFPLVGLGLITAAIRKTIQSRKFGECIFVMGQVPGVLGGEVTGTVIVPRGLATNEPVEIRLSCIHEVVRRSGKSTTTDEITLWQTENVAAQLSPTGEGAALGAAARFTVPFDAKPTERIDQNNRIFWKLEAKAAVPGVDFAATFEIPVFVTQTSSEKNTEELLRSMELKVSAPMFAPAAEPAFTVVPGVAGGTEFVIRPARGATSILPGTIMGLIFGGIGVLLAHGGAPFIFPLVFGGIALLIVFLLTFGAYGESRIVVVDGHVSVRNSLFGIMRGNRILCSSITKINVRAQGNTGKRGSYSIVLMRNDGKSFSPLQSLSERRQAEALAEEVRKAMEPWRTANSRK